jgi:hypothetical protein
MSRILKAALAVSASGVPIISLQAAPAHAASITAPAVLVGKLGIEGGAYPGKFHPTAGSVEVEFSDQPLVLDQPVGASGHFQIPLAPGEYTVIGCGPSASVTPPNAQCSKPKTITLKSGEVDHIRLIWLYAP